MANDVLGAQAHF